MENQRGGRPKGAGQGPVWNAERIRALRTHLGLTQQELSAELGTRQQTISEWETGLYQPRGASARLLSLIAERVGFGDQWAPRQGRASPKADERDTSL